jgi:hypothetical protein
LAICSRNDERCTPIDTGTRNVDFIIDRTVLPGGFKGDADKNGGRANSRKADAGNG